MTDLSSELAIPDSEERAVLNAALHKVGTPTGWWDDHGRPAPWPQDIDQYRTVTGESITLEPGQEPF